MRFKKLLLAGWITVACIAAGSVNAQDVGVLEQTGNVFSQIAKRAMPAVVFVDVESTVEVQMYGYRNPLEEFFGPGYFDDGRGQSRTREYHQQGQGSGFIISKDGYILTNNHVVGDAERITVTLGDGREFQAKLIGADPKTEVALIKIDSDEDLPFLPLGDSDAIQVGEWVLAAGNPFGLSQTITAGIVSAKERSEVGITEYANFIQTDAAINPGNSGGPLLNVRGEVIGINTAIYSQTGGYMGIGFAIPINQASQIKDQLIAYGRVNRSVLGIYIQEVDESLARSFGLDEPGGILISRVLEDSAAEKAGVQQGDIIVELDGRDTGKIGTFRSRVAAITPNTEVKLKIFRDGEYKTLTAVTQPMDPEQVATASTEVDEPSGYDRMGITVAELDPSEMDEIQVDHGVMITEVEEGGVAWRAGLREGYVISSVNRRSINSVESFTKALSNVDEGERVLLLVTDGRSSRFIVISLD
jgi:serine protease Do